MADTPYTEESFADWKARMGPSIAYMQARIKLTCNHDMDMEEAYAYMSWAMGLSMNRVTYFSSDNSRESIMQILAATSHDAMDRYKASLTGKFAPPRGARFESPAAAQAEYDQLVGGASRTEKTTTTPASTSTYTPGGYL